MSASTTSLDRVGEMKRVYSALNLDVESFRDGAIACVNHCQALGADESAAMIARAMDKIETGIKGWRTAIMIACRNQRGPGQ